MNEDILNFEVGQFKKEFGKKIDFTNLDKNNVDLCLEKALDDALRAGARRESENYDDKKSKIISEFSDCFIKIAKGELHIDNEEQFEDLFSKLKDKFLKILEKVELQVFLKIGYAQKFVNMAFKYLYCFDGCNKDNLKYCHLPLDKYTINWYKTIGDKNNIAKLKKINFSWSRIDEDLYFKIQEDIDSKLSIPYQINCKFPSKKIDLPKFKIKVDFIVWRQEQLNEEYKKLSKFKEYYERLGVKGI